MLFYRGGKKAAHGRRQPGIEKKGGNSYLEREKRRSPERKKISVSMCLAGKEGERKEGGLSTFLQFLGGKKKSPFHPKRKRGGGRMTPSRKGKKKEEVL